MAKTFTDTERLDWFEQHPRQIVVTEHPERGIRLFQYREDGHFTPEHLADIRARDHGSYIWSEPLPSLREAIDGALSGRLTRAKVSS